MQRMNQISSKYRERNHRMHTPSLPGRWSQHDHEPHIPEVGGAIIDSN